MSKLPADMSGRDVRAALERAGFRFLRQRGSHMVLRREYPRAYVVVPDHKAVRTGTLHQIVRDAGITVEEFVQLVRR